MEDIRVINRLAIANGLEVIPLIQTFGHMEFVLKHQEFSELRENLFEVFFSILVYSLPKDDSICVSDVGSLELIREMIGQVKELHPFVTRIHIGSDEVYHVGEDARCRRELGKLGNDHLRALERLKIRHIARF